MTTQRDLDIASNQSAFLPVGHALPLPALPDLSPSRFTDLDQSADPAQPRTRLIKDVLRVGDWPYVDKNGQQRKWHVTQDTLHEVANCFRDYQQRGNASNFIWGHSDDNRDAIEPADQLIVSDGVLWATGYFTPEEVKDLKNPSRKVSIRVEENALDGDGNVYSQLPIHFAVVERPVVPGQGPFRDFQQKQRAIALSLLRPSRRKDLAMDFETVKAGLNELFKSVGMDQLMIPDHVTDETTFDQWIKDAVAFINPGETVDTDGELDDAGGDAVPAEPEGEPAMSLSKTQGGKQVDLSALVTKAVNAAVEPLKKELSALKTQKANDAKAEYTGYVKDLGQAGLPGDECERLTKLGERHGWDMELLAGAENNPKLDMSRVAKPHRNGTAPRIENNGQRSDEDVKKDLEAAGVDTGKMPKSRI